MAETIDTYSDAWNATDGAERHALIERCLTSDVELIDENGRFSGHDGLGALMAKFHQPVPGGRIVKASGFDKFEGITRYSWDVVDGDGNTKGGGLDVVQEGADGRLQRIVMFHGPLRLSASAAGPERGASRPSRVSAQQESAKQGPSHGKRASRRAHRQTAA